MIDFGNGEPADADLPCGLIERATSKLFLDLEVSKRYLSSHSLGYGNDTQYFNTKVAEFLMKYANRPHKKEDYIVPCGGVSQGLDMITTMLCSRHANHSGASIQIEMIAFVEDVTYFISKSMLENH